MTLGECSIPEIRCGEMSWKEATECIKQNTGSLEPSMIDASGAFGARCLLASATKADAVPVHCEVDEDCKWHQLTVRTSDKTKIQMEAGNGVASSEAMSWNEEKAVIESETMNDFFASKEMLNFCNKDHAHCNVDEL